MLKILKPYPVLVVFTTTICIFSQIIFCSAFPNPAAGAGDKLPKSFKDFWQFISDPESEPQSLGAQVQSSNPNPKIPVADHSLDPEQSFGGFKNASKSSSNSSWFKAVSYEIPLTIYTSPTGEQTISAGMSKTTELKDTLLAGDKKPVVSDAAEGQGQAGGGIKNESTTVFYTFNNEIPLSNKSSIPMPQVSDRVNLNNAELTTSTKPKGEEMLTKLFEDGNGGMNFLPFFDGKPEDQLKSRLKDNKFLSYFEKDFEKAGFGGGGALSKIAQTDTDSDTESDTPILEKERKKVFYKTYSTKSSNGNNENRSTIYYGSDGSVTQSESWKESKVLDANGEGEKSE